MSTTTVVPLIETMRAICPLMRTYWPTTNSVELSTASDVAAVAFAVSRAAGKGTLLGPLLSMVNCGAAAALSTRWAFLAAALAALTVAVLVTGVVPCARTSSSCTRNWMVRAAPGARSPTVTRMRLLMASNCPASVSAASVWAALSN